MKTLFHVNGPLIWLDENGDPSGVYDAFTLVESLREHYDAVGIGADYVDTLIR
jgi:2,4'-dihydroxyacetophenone dioxygenase